MDSDVDDDFNRLFYDNSDSDGSFDGFDEIETVFANRSVIGELPMADFNPAKDELLKTDTTTGWIRSSTSPENAPFTGQSTLNADVGNNSPLEFFKLFFL